MVVFKLNDHEERWELHEKPQSFHWELLYEGPWSRTKRASIRLWC